MKGSCLCGDVAYEVDGALGALGNCHCRTCRKAHGAAYSTTARAAREAFRWTKGSDLVDGYESSPGKTRFFCPRCGSQLMAAWADAPHVIVRVGSLDDDPGTRPIGHIWTSQKAPWHEITDDLPQFAEGVGSARTDATGPSIDTSAPQLLVDDLDAALAFYRDRLGFAVDFVYESFYAAVVRGGAVIHLKWAPKLAAERAHRAKGEHLDVYLGVTDVRALHDEFVTLGAPIVQPLCEQAWGNTDFQVRDRDGYVLCFSEVTAK